MREPADLTRIQQFMRALGDRAREESRVYLTGGATAVLHGWRNSTIDVDVKFVPERDELFRGLQDLKEQLQLNVELASPADFIPVRSDWQERSPFIRREGRVSFHHFDLCAQALAKIERGHDQDRQDVDQFLRAGLVTREQLAAYFEAVAPQMYRYPALDAASFRKRLQQVLDEPSAASGGG
jgi:hypothetical protein